MFRDRSARAMAQRTGQIPLREVDTGSASVRVSPTSRQGCPQFETAIGVGINRSEETVLYFQSTVNYDIPNAYVAPSRHGLSTFGLNEISRCLHHPLKDHLSLPSFRLLPAFQEQRDFRFSTDQRCESSGSAISSRLWHHSPQALGTRGEAQPHLGGSVPLTLHSKISLYQAIRRFTHGDRIGRSQSFYALKQCWALPPVPTVPDDLLRPSPRQRPAQYVCLYGERAGYLCLVADGYSGLPSHRGYPSQYVRLVGHHLHGPGDSQNRRGAHPLAVERYVHRSVDNLGTHRRYARTTSRYSSGSSCDEAW